MVTTAPPVTEILERLSDPRLDLVVRSTESQRSTFDLVLLQIVAPGADHG